MRTTATRILRFEQKKLIPFEGTLDEMKAAGSKNPAGEDLKLVASALEMRMAELSARLGAPKKGDRPDLIQAEYLETAGKLRELKRQLTQAGNP